LNWKIDFESVNFNFYLKLLEKKLESIPSKRR